MKYIALLAATAMAQKDPPAEAVWVRTGTANFTAWVDKDDRNFVRYQAKVPLNSWLAIALTDKTYKKGDDMIPAMQGDFFLLKAAQAKDKPIGDNEMIDFNGDKDQQPSR